MRELHEFEEFETNGFTVTTDLGSAWFDGGKIHIEGTARKTGSQYQVTVSIVPEDTPEFNTSVSASTGEITSQDLEFKGELVGIEDVETGESLV